MANNYLKVNMLGSFSINFRENVLSDSDNRSRKVWLLLAYMIYYRKRPIQQQEMITLLWRDDTDIANPGNAIKTMLHRVRSMLNALGDGVGYELIIRKNGTYAWNPKIATKLDIEEFGDLVAGAAKAKDDKTKLKRYLDAISLYNGDFLPKLGAEPWIMPITVYYHNQYLQAVKQALPLLENNAQYDEVVALCRKALQYEPFDEDIYYILMRNLLLLGQNQEVVDIYKDISGSFFANFGVLPSDNIRALYHEAARTVNDSALPLNMILSQLHEQDPEGGALFCDYDFFKNIYQAEARFVARSGDAIHIGLITVTDTKNKELGKRSQRITMANLQDLICKNLRRGDVVARCSGSQFIILLPQANYENSNMVLERIVKSFYRQYPHTPARLTSSLHPIEPVL